MIEAGLGGRFDATNVIPSKVQVLTSVGLEHTRWLGPTAIDIAEEKLAVVRDHGTLVVRRARARAAGRGRARGGRAPSARSCTRRRRAAAAPLRAAGGFQRGNFAVAAAAAEAFLGRALDPDAVQRAAAQTLVPGRAEPVADAPLTVYDGAHNPAGAHVMAESLDEVLGDRRPRVAVIGVLEDKDAAAMLAELLRRVRPGGVHALAQPALAVARHAGVAGREAGRPARGDRGRPARGRGPGTGAGGPRRGRAGHRLDLPDRRPGERAERRACLLALTHPSRR